MYLFTIFVYNCVFRKDDKKPHETFHISKKNYILKMAHGTFKNSLYHIQGLISKRAHFNRSIIKKQHIPHLGTHNEKVCIQEKFEDFYYFHFVTKSVNYVTFKKGHISKGAHSKNSTFHISDHIIKRGASKTSLRIFIIFILLPIQPWHIPKTANSIFRALFRKVHISIGAYSKNSTFHIQGLIPKSAHFNRSIFQKQQIPRLGPYSKKGTFQQEHIPKTAHSTFRAIFKKGHISK